MKILYYGACWPTNIGNAFIDYGSIYTIKTAVPESKVFFASELPRWLFNVNKENMIKSIDLAELMSVDFIVISGMSLCDEFIEVEGPIVKKLSSKGVKIIYNGCGGATYEKTEVNNFRRFLKNTNVSGFISRDEHSFDNYKDCCLKSYNGIDCAFFLSDAFDSAPLVIKDFVVYSFDFIEEPKITELDKRIIRTHHACIDYYPVRSRETILTVERRMPFIKINKQNMISNYFRHDTLVSDIPDDYLNLYANAYAVYSDRVHACTAALSFGNFTRLFSTTPRASLFDRMGVGEIRKKLVKIDHVKLNWEKEKQISFLRETFRESQ